MNKDVELSPAAFGLYFVAGLLLSVLLTLLWARSERNKPLAVGEAQA